MTEGRILVTGATGFVGQALVASLQAQGRSLTLAVRAAGSRKDAANTRVVPVGSIGSGTDWNEALEEVGCVVHLAAHVHVEPERAEREADLFDEVNHLGALRLFEAASTAGTVLFIFVSSITVLGTETEPGEPFTDGSLPRPTTPYARSKHAAEIALTRAAMTSRTRLVILRPPLIVGPGVGGNLDRLLRLAAAPIPLPLGGLRNWRTILALDSLVAALEAVITRGSDAPAGTYVLGEDEALSTSDMLRELRAGLGRRARLLPAPRALMRAALNMAGRRGLVERLFGSLEVDSSGFRRAFAPMLGAGPRAALRETARAWAVARDGRSRCQGRA